MGGSEQGWYTTRVVEIVLSRYLMFSSPPREFLKSRLLWQTLSSIVSIRGPYPSVKAFGKLHLFLHLPTCDNKYRWAYVFICKGLNILIWYIGLTYKISSVFHLADERSSLRKYEKWHRCAALIGSVEKYRIIKKAQIWHLTSLLISRLPAPH